MESGVYTGTLRHRRFSPARHEFTYPLFMVFLDIDQLPELMKVSPLAGYNRRNWVSYQERDHFGDPTRTLRERVSRRRFLANQRACGSLGELSNSARRLRATEPLCESGWSLGGRRRKAGCQCPGTAPCS